VIPYGRQSIEEEDIQAVVNVLRSDFLTQGPIVPKFERFIAEYCGAGYAVAMANATAALHAACLAMGLKKGGLLWTSPNSFVASANCGLYCGADIDFVDIDPITRNLSVPLLREKLIHARATGRLPQVVVPVHFGGHSCDMAAIKSLAVEFGFKILEDASHAVGGRYRGTPVGSCQYSDMAVFSFHPVKIMTTGEGGMVLTNDPALYERLCLFRSHGITRDADKMESGSDGPWYYQQLELGHNFRLTEMQAALGLSQAGRVDRMVEKRNILADNYDKAFASLPLQLPPRERDVFSAFHLYVICLDSQTTGAKHREMFEFLQKRGIGVNLHYIPIHTQPYYRRLGFRKGDFPAAESYYARAISLPMFYGLTDEQQAMVVEAVRSSLE
jgi:UDP-4-amino-4,6-dideoxy-N-acetyl-beta-L-altrosamine transaminase